MQQEGLKIMVYYAVSYRQSKHICKAAAPAPEGTGREPWNRLSILTNFSKVIQFVERHGQKSRIHCKVSADVGL